MELSLQRLFLCVVAVCSLGNLPVLKAKRVEGTLSLNSYVTEQYISKFSFSKGKPGIIKGSFSSVGGGGYFDRRPHDLRILLLDDEAWPGYYDGSFTKHGMGSLCQERIRMASWQQRITPKSLGKSLSFRAEFHGGGAQEEETSFQMTVSADGRKRTHFWYAVVADCYLEEYDAHPPEVHFDITFHNGGSHLPADEMGLPLVYGFVLLATFVFMGFVLSLTMSQYKRVGQVHLIVLLLGVAVVLQTVSHSCELSHLITFMINGKGLRWRHTVLATDFVAQIALGLSELLIEFLLITLAFGWTLMPKGDVSPPLLGRFGLALSSGSAWVIRMAFFSAIAAAQVVLAMLGRRYEDDFNQFHDFEHPPGYCLMALRVGLCALFILGGLNTIQRSRGVNSGAASGAPNSDSLAVGSFMWKLLALGALWFLAFPVLVVFASPFFEPYNRHPVVTGGSIVLQSVALGSISTLFLQNSSYLKLSTLAHMGTIFGGAPTRSKWLKVAVD